jgi:hypothetical protein
MTVSFCPRCVQMAASAGSGGTSWTIPLDRNVSISPADLKDQPPLATLASSSPRPTSASLDQKHSLAVPGSPAVPAGATAPSKSGGLTDRGKTSEPPAPSPKPRATFSTAPALSVAVPSSASAGIAFAAATPSQHKNTIIPGSSALLASSAAATASTLKPAAAAAPKGPPALPVVVPRLDDLLIKALAENYHGTLHLLSLSLSFSHVCVAAVPMEVVWWGGGVVQCTLRSTAFQASTWTMLWRCWTRQRSSSL